MSEKQKHLSSSEVAAALASRPRELQKGEPHPAAVHAIAYLTELDEATMIRVRDTIKTGLAQHNRLAEVCDETLKKMDAGLPASDTELLGLAFTIINT